ncbi:SUN domain-containing protein 1-like isoform X1 [Esox lucius]|uniref:SUN domain-containing protein 1-like isoform X1 n=1 Tax=Esox lucius TaxID=8010 RepID=UPI001476F117|nr:SUN domain-containing protein 1-like isoform X1 [Esox lucius]
MDTVQKEIEMLKQWKESKPQNLPVVVQRITKDLRDLRTEVNNVKEILDSRVSSGDFSRADRGSPLVDEMADYALQAQGGTIVTSRCSKTYDANAKVLNIMGIPLFKVTESPWTVIGGHPLQPGNCWPFQGSKGRLTVSLSHPVHVTHVSLEHIPAAVSPYGHIKSAPKEFAIYGMSTEQGEGSLLGTFTYDQAGDSLQMFEMPRLNNVYQFVELHVLQNWGDEDYTCLYRFHVHGKMTSD